MHYHFLGYQDENLKLVSQQYRAWSDCTDVQAGLALYCWQKLITLGSSRIRVNKFLYIADEESDAGSISESESEDESVEDGKKEESEVSDLVILT